MDPDRGSQFLLDNFQGSPNVKLLDLPWLQYDRRPEERPLYCTCPDRCCGVKKCFHSIFSKPALGNLSEEEQKPLTLRWPVQYSSTTLSTSSNLLFIPPYFVFIIRKHNGGQYTLKTTIIVALQKEAFIRQFCAHRWHLWPVLLNASPRNTFSSSFSRTP